MPEVRLLPDDIRVEAAEGSTISEAARKAGIHLAHPCGGRGLCGRCTVFVEGQPALACVTPASQSPVYIPDAIRLDGQAIPTDIRTYDPRRNRLPRVERADVTLDPPTLSDPASDAERLCGALSARYGVKARIEASCLPDLPGNLRADNFTISPVIVHEDDGVTVLSCAREPLCGIAADVGTTTVAAALCDLETGRVLDTVAAPNPQAEYGADIITRIVYTEETPFGARTLKEAILNTLSDCIKILSARAGIPPERIPVMAIAGNTVMSHFLLGIPADYLRREPYVPAARIYPAVRPSELGLPLLPCGRVIILPSVASYVGGDITAGVIALDLAARDSVNILADVGTNGEIVLSGPGFMTACSCSMGPAFEGSGISCGSRAVRGAVDNVYCREGNLIYETIGGPEAEPKSVCGSGLVSLLSALLEKGVIDRSGRFTTPENYFTLTRGVTITQADISNLIRAKAAIYAGMSVLARQLDMSLSDIDAVYVAGGFGRGINIEHAVNIGMLPPLPNDRFRYAGNTSLAGALRVLCDRTVNAGEAAASITNIELSIGNEFMEEFIKSCFLPHTEGDFFLVKQAS